MSDSLRHSAAVVRLDRAVQVDRVYQRHSPAGERPQAHRGAGAGPQSHQVVLRVALALALLVAALSTSGCLLFPKKQVRTFVPPPVQHTAPEPLKLAAIEAPELPLRDTSAGLDLADLSPEIAIAPPPPPPETPRPRAPVVIAPKPPPAPVAPEPPPPKIVQIFPAEQQRAYNRELDEILERDQRDLEILARKNLAADQRERMAQIQELLTQAKQAREQDLVTAINLARRADNFVKDLLDRLP